MRQNEKMIGTWRACAALASVALLPSVGRAQDSGTVPPSTPANAPAGAPGPGAPGPQAGGPPPLPVLLGFADFLLTLERPWRAEPLYRLILMQDPNNEVAQRGLRDALNQQKIGFTSLAHSYYDSKDVQLFAYGGGPVIRTPLGKVTVTVGNGYYKNNNNPNNRRNPLSKVPTIPTAEDNFALNKQTYNVEFQPFWGKNMEHEGSAWVSWQTYDSVPDRLLYDFRYSYIPKPGREKFTFGTGRHDSFYQNQINQFLAPETFFQLQRRITFNDYYTAIEYPLAQKYDLNFTYRHFKYRDNNERNNFRTVLWYRLKPTNPMKPMPVWRVGLDGIVDQGRFFTLDYGIPRDFRSLSIATDYVMLTRDLKYVVYLSYPIAEKNFAAPAGLVAYVSKTLGRDKRFEVYGKSVILEARNLSVSLYDYVLGLNTRF
ncbi:MAG: hypothetical protein SFU56_20480 [Capsulimonadales bacterium]|nr:hypothetical protein [Capsulimonadales bacterium]